MLPPAGDLSSEWLRCCCSTEEEAPPDAPGAVALPPEAEG